VAAFCNPESINRSN